MADGAPPTNGSGLDWVAQFADAVGVDPPSEDDVTALLDLAGVAAHSSERLAAPLACYLVGRAGLAPTVALDLARRLAEGQLPPSDPI